MFYSIVTGFMISEQHLAFYERKSHFGRQAWNILGGSSIVSKRNKFDTS